MAGITRWLKKGLTGLTWLLQALVGRWQWQLPPWLQWLTLKLTACTSACSRHPKTSLASVFSLLLIAAGGLAGYRWYQAQPKPVYPHCDITAPALTQWPEDQIKISPLILECDDSVAPLEAVGKPQLKGLELKPKMAGQWLWQSDRKLVFTPSVDWPIAQGFELDLAKQKLLAPQVHLDNYHYSFTTAPFTAKITESQFYQDPSDPALKKLVASVQFSHSVNPEEFEQHTQLSLPKDAKFLGINDDATEFTITYDKLKHKAFIHSHSLSLPRENTPLQLTLKKGFHASRGGNGTAEDLTSAITIPGRFSLTFSDFSMILADNEKLEPEQVLLFKSLAPVPDAALEKRLNAWLLPVNHPNSKPQDANYPYDWSSREVDKKILAAAEPLNLKLIPSDDSTQLLHSYQFLAPAGRFIYIEVAAGINAIGGTSSAKPSVAVVAVSPYQRSLKLMGDGGLLGLNGERKIGLVARAIDGVKLEVGRVLPNQLHQLLAANGGRFTIPDEYNEYQEDRLVERFTELRPLASTAPGKPIYDNVDLSGYFGANATPSHSKLGLFLVRASGLQNSPSSPTKFDEYAYADAKDSRLLLVTDLGILSKTNLDGSRDIFVQSISRGEAVAGAKVEMIGRNGLALETRTTDPSGWASLPKMDPSYKKEKTPQFILVSQGDDMSFLPLNAYDRRLNLSRFDIGGIESNLDPNTLSSFIFSDRGIYRPGEELHLGAILRTQNWQGSVEGIPLEAEITDPRGLAVHKETFTASATGLNELQWQSQGAAPTGTYTVAVYLRKSDRRDKFLGSTSVRLQEFEPDRIKVSASLTAAPVLGWLTPEQVTAKVSALNLFGTPASGRRVAAELTLAPALPSFSQYADYRFYDSSKFNDPQTQVLADGKTDDLGQAVFDLNLARFAKATYRLSFLARVFEAEGGRNVAAFSDLLVSSSPYLVGIKKADTDLNYLQKNAKHSSRWLAINPQLEGQNLTGLQLEWIQRKYVSVLLKQDNGTYRYQSRLKETQRNSQPFTLAAKGTDIPLPTEEPGDFALILRDADGRELNRLDYSVVGQGNLSRSLERNAELQIKLDKADYLPGDTLELAIQAPYTGAGLITIERDKVYNHVWFNTNTTSSVQHIKLPEGFEGNGYVTVQFVRAPGSDEVFTSPLSYGVMPFKMSLAPRIQGIQLKVPELIKPGQTLDIEVSASRPGKAVIYAVDEGILQVARYQAPAPLNFFFQKRRLEVDSSQILDLILPEFSQLLKASAPGGDADGALARHLNPFKNKRKAPAVYWSGLVDVGPESTQLHYPVPDYFNGKLHLFAVMATAETLGVAESGTEVRGDLILNPNLPAILAPGDEVDVSFSLANNLKTSQGEVEVQLKTSPHLTVVGAAAIKLSIDPGKEGQGSFRLKAADLPGAASLSFSATLGKAHIAVEEGLSVRPPVPYRTSITSGRTDSSAKLIATTATLYEPYRDVSFSAGYTPLAWAKGLQQYLDAYPYSCTEQLVSMGLPGLLFSQHPDLGQLKGKAKVSDVLQTLANRQNEDGAFGLYSASTEVANWPSLWAIQFLLEARDRGQTVPSDLLNRANNWLKQMANPWGNNLPELRQRAYAIYLLSRQGVQTGSQLGALQQELAQRFPDTWPKDVAAAYVAVSQHLLQQQDLAVKTLSKVPWSNATSNDNYYDALSHQAQLLYLTAKYFPGQLSQVPNATLDAMADHLSKRQYTSLSAAYLLLALTQYGEAATSQNKGPLRLSATLAQGPAQNLPVNDSLLQLVKVPLGAVGIQIQQDTNLPLFYSLAESGFEKAPANAPEVKNGLEVQRDYLALDGKEIDQVTVGQEFLVRIRARAIDLEAVDQIALVDLLPGGVEPVINRAPGANKVAGEGNGQANNVAASGSNGEGSEGEASDTEGSEGDGSEGESSEAEGSAGNGGNSAEVSDSHPVPGFSGEPEQTTWHAQYADLRDDRLVIYGALGRDMVAFTYRVRATNTGTYQTPAAYAEAMYQPNLYAKGKSSTLKIVKPL